MSGFTVLIPKEGTLAAEVSVIQGEYFRDIMDQARALADTLAALRDTDALHQLRSNLEKGKFKTVVLTGMGSSFHALHPLYLQLIESGFTALMVETSELIHYQSRLFESGNLIVAVSQSGESAETVKLLEMNRGKSSVVGITNTAESTLAKRTDAAIVTRAGKEFSVSCKTYMASLLGLKWLGDCLCSRDLQRTRQELEAAAPRVRDYLADWEQHVQQLAERLRNMRHLFLVGRGTSLAAVGTGALTIKESDHVHAEGMSSAAFRHGPFEMLSDRTFVLVFAGDGKTRELNVRLVKDIRDAHGQAELVSEGEDFIPCALPSGPPSVQPILEVLPAQMITLALAALAGREAGRFEHATKITTTE